MTVPMQHAQHRAPSPPTNAPTTPSTTPPATSAIQQIRRCPSDQTPAERLRSAIAAAALVCSDRSTGAGAGGARLFRLRHVVLVPCRAASIGRAPAGGALVTLADPARSCRARRSPAGPHREHQPHQEQRGRRDDRDLPGDEHQRDRTAGQHERPVVEDEHGLPVGVPDGQHPVVQVLLVGAERVPALLGPPDHRQQEVQHRDEHHRQRNDQRSQQRDGGPRPEGRRVQLAAGADGGAGHGQPDEHRAGIAHEDPRRREVVRQEADAGAEQGRGDQRRLGGGARRHRRAPAAARRR